MFPRVIDCYAKKGFRVNLGNPNSLSPKLVEASTGRVLGTGTGISLSDALLFVGLSKLIVPPASIFIIGNAFGLSSFTIADLFPNATIDVIDAEIEGDDNSLGSKLTRDIAKESFPNVNLTIGFSPQDLSKAVTRKDYDLIFIDGEHTNKQMIADFEGILPYTGGRSIIIFHDVVMWGMLLGWETIKKMALKNGFSSFDLGHTSFGLTSLVRGYEEAKSYLSNISSPFNNARYGSGIPYSPTRGRIFNKTLYEIELSIRYHIRNIFC